MVGFKTKNEIILSLDGYRAARNELYRVII